MVARSRDGMPQENEELLQQVEDLMLKLSLAEAKANGAGSSGSNSGSGRGPVDSNIEVEDVDSPKCLRLRQMLEDMKVRRRAGIF